MPKEKARWKLYMDAACFFEQIWDATPNKSSNVQPFFFFFFFFYIKVCFFLSLFKCLETVCLIRFIYSLEIIKSSISSTK